ncbi:MAG TPA: MlaD family protein [Mycobacteriales bacterium]|nr:MlaD family protein [Mycobacteriales bacterium]
MWRTGVKLTIFVVVSLLLTLIVSNTVTRPLGHSTYTYRALFTDASGLRPGDDVDIAGVRVGRVTGEKLSGDAVYADGKSYPDDALVTFEVERSQRFTTGARAEIRYEDLLGARFLSLEQATPTSTSMSGGAVFYPDRTAPALSLTALFNGFKPLFSALSPGQANQLAADIVADFQGEGGSITALLGNIAKLTGNLSQRDNLIGQVIGNLDVVLSSVADHDGDLASLIAQLQSLTHGLAADRHQIAGALGGLDAVARSIGNLVGKGEPILHHDIGDLFLVAGTLVRNEKVLAAAVRALPIGAAAFSRSLGYGSWLNGYVCAVAVKTGKLAVPVEVNGQVVHSAVCRTTSSASARSGSAR